MIVTLLLTAVTFAVSMSVFNHRDLGLSLAMWPSLVHRKHQYYRFITYGFVHADMQHLLFNMITLFFFGAALEPLLGARIGPLGFGVFYLSALVVSILPSYLKHRRDPQYLGIGASGAVSAVLFAFIMFQPWAMIYVFFILPIPAVVFAVLYVAYSIYMDRRGKDNINHSAHLWGAAYGVLVTLVATPDVLQSFLGQLLHPGFAY